MIIARRVGAIVLALAALVVWFGMAPKTTDRSSDISAALADYQVNNARTDGAPQQQVVNGWVAKDLLTVIAEQQNETTADKRVPALACLLVLGLALMIATSPALATASVHPPAPLVNDFPHPPVQPA